MVTVDIVNTCSYTLLMPLNSLQFTARYVSTEHATVMMTIEDLQTAKEGPNRNAGGQTESEAEGT